MPIRTPPSRPPSPRSPRPRAEEASKGDRPRGGREGSDGARAGEARGNRARGGDARGDRAHGGDRARGDDAGGEQARSKGPGQPHPRSQNDAEHKVSGKNACLALFAKRRDDIRRVYVTDENVKALGECLKWCAANRIAYHIKTTADLDAVAETVHHDGVMFMARQKKPGSLDDLVAKLQRDRGRVIVVLLEDVKNPHNLGAILRVCAHFGVAGVLAAGDTPALSPAAMRTAEGGAEHIEFITVGDGVDAIEQLRQAGVTIVGTSSHTGEAIGAARMPPRALVLFGSEGEGLSQKLLALADSSVAIPGSGALESLNVACASSVILWELWRPRLEAGRDAAREPVRAPESHQTPRLRDAPPRDEQPRDEWARDARPSDARPSDARPRDARPRDARPRDARPHDARPHDARPRTPGRAPPSQHRPSAAPRSGPPTSGRPTARPPRGKRPSPR